MNKVYDFPPKPIIFYKIGEIVFPSLAKEYIDENFDIKVYDFPPMPIIFHNIGEIVFPSLANEYIYE